MLQSDKNITTNHLNNFIYILHTTATCFGWITLPSSGSYKFDRHVQIIWQFCNLLVVKFVICIVSEGLPLPFAPESWCGCTNVNEFIHFNLSDSLNVAAASQFLSLPVYAITGCGICFGCIRTSVLLLSEFFFIFTQLQCNVVFQRKQLSKWHAS